MSCTSSSHLVASERSGCTQLMHDKMAVQTHIIRITDRVDLGWSRKVNVVKTTILSVLGILILLSLSEVFFITASCYSTCVADRAKKNEFKTVQAEQVTPYEGATPIDGEDWEVLKEVADSIEVYENEVLMDDDHAIINYVLSNDDALDPDMMDQEMIEKVNAIRSKYVNPFGMINKMDAETKNSSTSHNTTGAEKMANGTYEKQSDGYKMVVMNSEDVNYEINKLQFAVIS